MSLPLIICPKGHSGAQSCSSRDNYLQVFTSLGRESKEWCDGRADPETKQLIDFQTGPEYAIVYTDESVLWNQRSGWGLSAKVRVEDSAEQGGVYQATSSTRMQLGCQSGTEIANIHLTRVNVSFDSVYAAKGTEWVVMA